MNISSAVDWLTWDALACGRLCLVLFHSLWQTSLLAALAWSISRLWYREKVERCYQLYVAALVLSLLALPLTRFFLGTDLPTNISRVTSTGGSFRLVMAPVERASTTKVDHSSFDTVLLNAGPSTDRTVAPAGPTLPAAAQRRTAAPRVGVTFQGWQQFAPWMVGLYLSGLLLMLGRLVIGMWQTHRLSLAARPLTTGPIPLLLEQLVKRWSLRIVPVLKQTEQILVPKVVGLLRPTILLPTSAITGLSTDELEMILIHEVAHVRRYDMWVNLLQRLAETVLFFNPALWYLSRQVSLLREYCCDELTCGSLVENQQDSPRARYALALLRVVELTQGSLATSEVTALAANGNSPSELRRRVARLFGESTGDALRLSRGGLFLVSAVVLVLLLLPQASQSQTTAELEALETKISTVAGPQGNESLKKLAAATGGQYYVVTSPSALPEIYRRHAGREGQLLVDAALLAEAAAPKKGDLHPAEATGLEESITPSESRRGRESHRPVISFADLDLGRVFSQTKDVVIWTRPVDSRSPAGWLWVPAEFGRCERYQIPSQRAFLESYAARCDVIAGEDGFFADLLQSLAEDSNGPRIDVQRIAREQFGNRVTRITRAVEGGGEAQLWAWEVPDEVQLRKTMARLLPEALNVSPRSRSGGNPIWLVDLEDANAAPLFVTVAKGHFCLTENKEFLLEFLRHQGVCVLEPEDESDPETDYLDELVDSQVAIYEMVNVLHEEGAPGGTDADRALAAYALALAKAQRAAARGQAAEALAQYRAAVQAAEENVATRQLAYRSGTTTLTSVLEANRLRAEAKRSLYLSLTNQSEGRGTERMK